LSRVKNKVICSLFFLIKRAKNQSRTPNTTIFLHSFRPNLAKISVFRTVREHPSLRELVKLGFWKVEEWYSRILCSGQNKTLVRLESSELASEIIQPQLGFVKNRL